MSNKYNPATMPKVLRDEFLHQKDVEIEDDDNDYVMIPKPDDLALEDAIDRTLYNDDETPHNKRLIIKWLITVGELVEISQEQMANTVVTRGKVYDYKVDGKYYVWEVK